MVTKADDVLEPPAPASSDPDCPARKRGRPKAAIESMAVTTWLPITIVDQLCRLAKQRDESISALIRSILKFRTRDGR